MLGLKVVQVRKDGVVSLYGGHPLHFGGETTAWRTDEMKAECRGYSHSLTMTFTAGSASAEPVAEEKKEHRPPAEGCLCGFHGAYHLDTLRDYFNDRDESENDRVVVLIEGWGKITKHEKGWRSEYARLQSIVDISEHPWAVRDHDRRIIYKGYALRAAQLLDAPIIMLSEVPDLQPAIYERTD